MIWEQMTFLFLIGIIELVEIFQSFGYYEWKQGSWNR